MTNTQTQNFISVKFANPFPGKLVEFTLNGLRTLRALLEESGMETEKVNIAESDIRVNGQRVTSLDHELVDGDLIFSFKLIKGNSSDPIVVRIGTAPGGAPEQIAIEAGSTVAQAMVVAEIETGVYDIFVNDTGADADTQLRNGDLVIIKNSPAQETEPDEDYDDDYDEEYYGEDESPSQILFAAAAAAERSAELLRSIAQECDESEEFLGTMYRAFGS